MPGFEAIEWIGMVAPAGTPAAVTSRVHQALVKALASPDVKERVLNVGADPVGNTPEVFSAFVKKEIAAWAKVIREVGITID